MHADSLMHAGSWAVFTPFSGLHVLAVAVCMMPIAAIAILGRRLAASPAELRVRKVLAIFAGCFWVIYNGWWSGTAQDLANNLPLHICDFNGVIAPLALLTSNRWLRATLYFWTTTLTLQAFIQPTLTEGPAFVYFWTFWTSHTIILACAAYDLAVLGFRPDWADFRRACLVSVAYLAFITPVNLTLGSNYGFVGNPPPEHPLPPAVEALGPWPGRVGIMAGLAIVGFVLALSPFLVAGARRNWKQGSHASATDAACQTD